MTLRELAAALGCAIENRSIDGSSIEDQARLEITGVQGMDLAGPGQITFLSNPKYGPKLKATRASAVIASQAIEGIPTLVSANPYLDFARALEIFYQPPRPKPGVHPSA